MFTSIVGTSSDIVLQASQLLQISNYDDRSAGDAASAILLDSSRP